MKHIYTISALVLLLTCSVYAEDTSPITDQQWADYLASNAYILGAGLTVGFVLRFGIQFTATQLRVLRMMQRRGGY